ncbi:helix-turn-helix transcriptional regulator [Bittarella massiliensis (ex Durand et al. 2017)]|uniref:helix-turn-helix transcriptional regulator n=1 Tax=Bittarella massiliensis (ex Durand et al. 2017) TaxID=1720313 RepID=UPI001AA0FC02
MDKLKRVAVQFWLRLRLAREARGLTQEKMAELCGISPRNYHNLENGHTNPSLATALQIPSQLGFSLDVLREEAM